MNRKALPVQSYDQIPKFGSAADLSILAQTDK